jgi:hypothetical protein
MTDFTQEEDEVARAALSMQESWENMRAPRYSPSDPEEARYRMRRLDGEWRAVRIDDRGVCRCL